MGEMAAMLARLYLFCVATQIMLDCVQVPDSGTAEPSQQTIRAFVACIEEGNKHYDSAGCRGFLSVYGAIESVCSDINVTIARGGYFGVWDYDQFKRDLLTIRDSCWSRHSPYRCTCNTKSLFSCNCIRSSQVVSCCV